MTSHDSKGFEGLSQSKELMDKLNPKFQELTFDVQEIMELSTNPSFLGLMLFKIAEERKRANDLLEQINDKYDKIMFELKTRGSSSREEPKDLSILPEQDEQILNLVQEKGTVDAKYIQQALKYKGRNAASQRLNKLCKAGYLKKAQSGKKVLFYADA